MHSKFRFLPLVILSILALLHLYAYFGIMAELPFKTLQVFAVSSFNALLAIAIIAILIIFIGGNKISKSFRNFLFAFVFIDITTVLVFDVFLIIDDILRIILYVSNFGDGNRIGLLIGIGLIISIIPAILFILGMIIGPYRYKVRETTIAIPNLPDAFETFKIVQLSDIHAGSFYNKKAVNRGVNIAQQQNPDVFFFTGDLVNDDAAEMNEYQTIFRQLNAPYGVYSILGNHDYGDYVQWPSKEAKASNFEKLTQVHANMNWKLLRNEHVYLTKDNQKIGLIGVENWGKGFHQFGDMEKASFACEADVKILLSHDPTHWEEEVIKKYKDIDLTLSGHTHGAQMGFEIGKYKWSPIQLRYKKWAGLYNKGEQFLYINRGFGFLGYPGRLGIWPEITVITLTKEHGKSNGKS